MTRALIFDFDGLILDTESTDFAAWEAVYREHGQTLAFETWCERIGGDGGGFDPMGELVSRVGPLDALEVGRKRRALRDELVARLEPRPGVIDWLDAAQARGLALGVASSSPRSWLESLLGRAGLLERFGTLASRDDVARAKPHPEVYRVALRSLGVAPEEALAIEDSPNGLAAARAAGLRCVAVPGPMTRHLAFDAAELVLESLAEHALDSVLERVAARAMNEAKRIR